MEVQEASTPHQQQFRFAESSGQQPLNNAHASTSGFQKETIVVARTENNNSNGIISTTPQVADSATVKDHFNLANAKAIDLIGEEFVSKLKAEPNDEEERPAVVMSMANANSETTTVMAGGEQSHLVYCNLNDLDISGNNETYSLASLHSLAEASSTVQQPAVASERSPYSAVSTILLQGGILQVRFGIYQYFKQLYCTCKVWAQQCAEMLRI